MQANEILKIILGIGTTLSGKLLSYNALTSQTSIIKVKKNEAIFKSILKNKEGFHKTKVDFHCEVEVTMASFEDLLSNNNIQFIDIREADEQPKIEGLEVTRIPLSQLENRINEIDAIKKKAIFCQSGIRSKHAVKILQEQKIKNCFSIIEGALEIKNYLKEQY